MSLPVDRRQSSQYSASQYIAGSQHPVQGKVDLTAEGGGTATPATSSFRTPMGGAAYVGYTVATHPRIALALSAFLVSLILLGQSEFHTQLVEAQTSPSAFGVDSLNCTPTSLLVNQAPSCTLLFFGTTVWSSASTAALSFSTLNWGDGTIGKPLDFCVAACGVHPPSIVPEYSHTYVSPGTYTLTASVTDPNGNPGTSRSLTFTVGNGADSSNDSSSSNTDDLRRAGTMARAIVS